MGVFSVSDPFRTHVRPFLPEACPNKYLPNQFHSSENYTSTLAHKLNHSFIANCEWSNAEHPCYGLVPSVTTFLDVQEGQELTINYGLDMEVAIWLYILFIN